MFTTTVDPEAILAKSSDFVTPLELKELYVKCEEPQLKPMLLRQLIVSKKMKKGLVFTKSADSSHSLAVLLKQFDLSVDELSSKVSFETPAM
jgi:superfamily II DNA/RNA helicase